MAVTINSERKGVEVQWDAGDFEGDIVIELVGGAGDAHQTARMPNDGYGLVSYPAEFSGSSQVRVLDADNQDNVLDEGDITIA